MTCGSPADQRLSPRAVTRVLVIITAARIRRAPVEAPWLGWRAIASGDNERRTIVRDNMNSSAANHPRAAQRRGAARTLRGAHIEFRTVGSCAGRVRRACYPCEGAARTVMLRRSGNSQLFKVCCLTKVGVSDIPPDHKLGKHRAFVRLPGALRGAPLLTSLHGVDGRDSARGGGSQEGISDAPWPRQRRLRAEASTHGTTKTLAD